MYVTGVRPAAKSRAESSIRIISGRTWRFDQNAVNRHNTHIGMLRFFRSGHHCRTRRAERSYLKLAIKLQDSGERAGWSPAGWQTDSALATMRDPAQLT